MQRGFQPQLCVYSCVDSKPGVVGKIVWPEQVAMLNELRGREQLFGVAQGNVVAVQQQEGLEGRIVEGPDFEDVAR